MARRRLIPESLRIELAGPYERELRDLETVLKPTPEVRAAPAVPAPQPVAPPPAPAVAPAASKGARPAAPRRDAAAARIPARPPVPRQAVNWEAVWQALLSPRALEALLYVGAILIIVAAGTFVYFNWGRFSPPLQLTFLAAGTASFFATGWLVQRRWHLPQSGAALIGIGALIIPVDFYAWARFRDLPPESLPALWLAASAVCLVAYALTTWWIRRRFFVVITLLAGHSLLLALLRFAGVSPPWWAAPTIGLAAGWARIGPQVDRLGPGLRSTVVTTTGAAVAASLLASALYYGDRWGAVVRSAGPAEASLLTVAAAWWAAVVYFAAAGSQRSIAWAHGAMTALVIAAVLTLLPVVPRAWVSLPLLALAAGYVMLGSRRGDPLAASASSIGMALPPVALLWAWMDLRIVPPAYLGGAAVYAWWTFRLGRPAFALAAHALAVVGLLTLASTQGVPTEFWSLALLLPAVAGIAVATRAQRIRAAAMSLYIGAFIEIVAAILMPSPLASLGTRVVVFATALLVAATSAVRLHRRIDPALEALSAFSFGGLVFQWSTALLAAAELAIIWAWWRPELHGLPLAGLLLASGFVLTAIRLGRMQTSYEGPWRITAFFLSLAAVLLAVALQSRSELLVTLLGAAATYALWAWLLREPAFAHLAAWVFLIPCAQLLPEAQTRGLLPSRDAYAWGFVALGFAYLLTGTLLDRRGARFAVPWHLIAQLLVPLALLWSLRAEDVARWTLAAAISFYAVSAALAHRGQAPTFRRMLQWVARRAPQAAEVFRAGFVYLAAALFPFWYHLTLRQVPYLDALDARAGVAAAALGWVYLAIGQGLRSIDAVYVTPLRIGAQALAIVGSLLATDHRLTLIIAMALGVAQQLAFVGLTRAVVWVYTAALGGTGLLGVILRQMDVQAFQAGWVLLALAGVYLAIAELPLRRHPAAMPGPAVALYSVAFLIAAVGMLLASFRGPQNAAAAYAGGVVVFLWAGWRLREPLFGYAVAGLLSATYVTGLVALSARFGFPESRYGIGLLPGIAILFAAARILRRHSPAWAQPFDIAAQIGTAAMVGLSAGHPVADPLAFPWALAIAAGVYGVSTLVFRSPRWLYPALLTLHLAIFFALLRLDLDPRLVPAVFVPVTMAVAFIGRWVERRSAWAGWVSPWYAIALAGVVVWEVAGVIDVRTHLLTSAGFALLAGVFAELRHDGRAASAALVLAMIGLLEGVRWLQVPYPTGLLVFSIAALGLGGMEMVAASLGRARLWQPGAGTLAFAVSATAIFAAVFGVVAAIHPDAGRGLVYTLAIVGLLYLLYSVRERLAWLGYVAVAMLEVAWAIFLLKGLAIREVQLYAIPASLYLLGVGAVERRLGRRSLAQVVDLAGLTLLFGSALWQSLGVDGFRYAVLLAIEAVIVTWFGAAQRLRRHFFGGLGVLLADVIIQAIDPLRALDKTILFLSLGVVLVVTAVLAERRREEIIRTTREWWTRLEAWE